MSLPSTAAVGGDPSKPGAWTPAQIADWNRQAACDHAAVWAANPRPYEDICGACGGIVRTVGDDSPPHESDYGDDHDRPYGNAAVAGQTSDRR